MNNTLNNGLALLARISDSTRSYGVTELAQSTSMPKSHVHRLLQSLVESRLLDKTDKGQYFLSLGILRLSRELLLNLPIRQVAMPVMMQMIQELDINLTLAVPYENDAISVAHLIASEHSTDTAESLGTVLTVRYTASGKLFLAHRSDQEQQAVFQSLDMSAPEKEALQAELKATLSQGYSVKDKTVNVKTHSFALPIRDRSGEVIAALGGSAPTEILSEAKIQQALPTFQKAIEAIETQLT